MIRFSAGLVVVAIGILVGGVATSKLLLVYVAIAVSAAALVSLAIGVVLKREELFGDQARTSADVASAGVTTGQSALVGQQAYGQPATAGQDAGVAAAQAAQAADWPAWDADSRQKSAAQPAARGAEGARQSPPPFGVQRTEAPAAAARASGADVSPGAWYQEPGQAPWSVTAKPDLPMRGRHAGPGRSESPHSATSTAAGPAAPVAAAAPTAPAPTAPPTPVPPPPPAPSWRRETPSRPGDADALATAEPRPATPGRPSAPGRPSGQDQSAVPSWFDRIGDPEPDAGAPADAVRAERPASTTKDKALGKAAPSKTDANKTAAEESEPAAAMFSPDATKASAAADAPDDSAADEGAALAAVDDGTDGVADLGPGAGAGDGSADDDAAADDRPADAAGDVETTEAIEPARTDVADDESADTDDPDTDRSGVKYVTVVPGVPRYHTANCILIRFMGDDDLQKTTVPEATAAGCTPCRACQPDTDGD